MDDFIEFLGIMFVAIIAIVLAIFIPAYAFDRISCSGFESGTGHQTKYEGLQCFAKVDDQWVPKEYVFGDAKELRLKEVR